MESGQNFDPQGQINPDMNGNNSNKTKIIVIDVIIGVVLIAGGYLYANRESLMPSSEQEIAEDLSEETTVSVPQTFSAEEQACGDIAGEFLDYIKAENVAKAYEVSSPYFKESETADSFQEFIDYNNFLIGMKEYKFEDIKIDRDYCDVYGTVYPETDNLSPIYLELVIDETSGQWGVSHLNFYSKERNVNEIQAIELCHTFFDYMYDKDFDGAYSMLSSEMQQKYTTTDLEALTDEYPIFLDNNTSDVTIADYSDKYIEATVQLIFEANSLSMNFELVKEDGYFKISDLSLLK